ncbi:MAG TPA: hypothetical protein VF169_02020 [Albitalea sp.]|uniref:hypothetical protein n=1 Tax=Piscinibacter sp. TaxID=1903157 RepID=UPI002ED68BE5
MKEDKPVAEGEPKPVVEKVGTHGLGMAAGAVGGAVAGAVGGLAAGPVGSLAGAVGGAVLGATLGGSTGEGPVTDLSAEEAWWRENYAGRDYVSEGAPFSAYESAYRYGMRAYIRSDRPREWDEVEAELAAGWDEAREGSDLAWDEARPAVRDAWNRLRTP